MNSRLARAVSYVPVEDIVPGPMQPRRHFSREQLEELAASIAEHGIIQPLSVRVKGEHFELIAGERRLRAAKMLGLREVPCIVMDVDLERSGLIALIENIQRRDLDFVEEAQGIYQLIRYFGLSQEECARRLGKSQSAVANKLRILRLPPELLERLRAEGLSERHARALLRLEDAEIQSLALDFIIDQRMSVAGAEEYIEKLCTAPEEAASQTEASPRRSFFVMKDVRIFLNSLSRSVSIMRKGGIDADVSRQETERELVVTVRIPKSK